jgi:predicted nucleotidyltransferase
MSVADFLFTPGMQRVLGATLIAPEQCFALNTLLKMAGTGKGSTQIQIERLIKAGVLKEEPRRSNQRSIRANTDFFLFPELRAIALKSFALAEPIREALTPFAHVIDQAFVFGSVTKGTDSHRSDIDLIVIGEAPLLDLTQAMVEVERKLGRPVNMTLYSRDEWEHLKQQDSIIQQIDQSQKIEVISNE